VLGPAGIGKTALLETIYLVLKTRVVDYA
jgi:recombinational DNA repair ATPase RecF